VQRSRPEIRMRNNAVDVGPRRLLNTNVISARSQREPNCHGGELGTRIEKQERQAVVGGDRGKQVQVNHFP
jgi:hypothetical protein